MTESNPSKQDTQIHWPKVAGVMLLVGAVMVAFTSFTAPFLIPAETQNYSITAIYFGSGVVLIALLGLIPPARMTRENLDLFLKAYFIGSATRFVLTILWVLIAAKFLKWFPATVVYSLGLTYLPLLLTEVVLLNTALRSSSKKKFDLNHNQSTTGTTGGGTEALA